MDELRDEVQLQVALLIERETTVALRVLDRLRENAGVATVEGLERFEDDLKPESLIEDLRRRLEEVDPGRSGEEE